MVRTAYFCNDLGDVTELDMEFDNELGLMATTPEYGTQILVEESELRFTKREAVDKALVTQLDYINQAELALSRATANIDLLLSVAI